MICGNAKSHCKLNSYFHNLYLTFNVEIVAVVRKDETKRRKPSKMKKVNQSSSTSTSPLSEKTQSGSTFIVPTQIITLPESAVISNLGTFIFTVPISSKSIKEEK